VTDEQIEETLNDAEPPLGPSDDELAAQQTAPAEPNAAPKEPTPEPSAEVQAKIDREQAIKEQTEAMAAEDGYPVETVDGEIVLIVEKRPSSQGESALIDADGDEWTMRGHDGKVEKVGQAEGYTAPEEVPAA
jgi:hypothetical protein